MKLGWRIWVLIIVILLSILAIRPSFETGVVVKSVDSDSEIFKQGLRQGAVIKSINNIEIKNTEDYGNVILDLFSDGVEKRIDFITKDSDFTLLTNQPPEISVGEIPNTKIKTGLDLRGGSRALVRADIEISDSQLEDLIQVSRNRFNVYGLSDVNIKGVTDLSGNKFMMIEIAGASPDDLKELVGKQGKFEGKISNETVFSGGEGDISDICRNDATCAGIRDCQQTNDGYYCRFDFTIYLTDYAAKKHAEATKNLEIDSSGQYLSEKLYLYIDDQEASSLLISKGLQGQETTTISIEGSGTGATREDAYNEAKKEMNKLQTILITGSLPYKLEIVKLDTISPNLGSEFGYLILLSGAGAIGLVSLIVFVRYRKFKISLALLLTSFSELLIILGVAVMIGWNLDLPSIAGILATIGTGVDQQIVILDEASRSKTVGIKERMKRALFVIMTAYLTSVVSLLPLYWAGAGLFKGFAFTTIIGITTGVLITRPAFAEMIKKIEE